MKFELKLDNVGVKYRFYRTSSGMLSLCEEFCRNVLGASGKIITAEISLTRKGKKGWKCVRVKSFDNIRISGKEVSRHYFLLYFQWHWLKRHNLLGIPFWVKIT